MKIKRFCTKILVTEEWMKDAVIKHDWRLKEMKKMLKKVKIRKIRNNKTEPKDQKE